MRMEASPDRIPANQWKLDMRFQCFDREWLHLQNIYHDPIFTVIDIKANVDEFEGAMTITARADGTYAIIEFSNYSKVSKLCIEI